MPPPVAFHDGFAGRAFPFASKPQARNWSGASVALRAAGSGVTRMEARAPGITRTFAAPEAPESFAHTVQSPTRVGVYLPVEGPVAFALPTSASHPGLTGTGFPSESQPEAAKSAVASAEIVVNAGSRVMAARGPAW